MNHNLEFEAAVVSRHDAPTAGLAEICMSGRSNVGKSSMINKLAGRHGLAKISQTPGKTRTINYYSVDGAFYLVDLPGYGYAKVSKSQREDFPRFVLPYLEQRQQLMGIIQLLDSRHGPVSGDKPMLEWLQARSCNVLYVFTKADKLSGNERAVMRRSFEKESGAGTTIMFSSKTGMGVADVWSWIHKTLGINEQP